MDQQFYEQRQQNMYEYIVDCWYNFRYLLSSYLSNPENHLHASSEFKVYILGKQIQVTQDNIDDKINEIKQIIRSTIWFTYRKNFPCLLESSYISDTGWGCMIRAGQMVLAQHIKRHLKSNADSRDKFLCNITQAFADNDENESKKLESILERIQAPEARKPAYFLMPFSIQKIAYLAQKEFNVQPGQWYKPNYILFVLEKLHNKFPIRGSDNLAMLVFNDSSLFRDQIVVKMIGETVISQKIGNEKKDKDLGFRHPTCQALIADTEFIHKQQANDALNAVSVFILTRIGLDEPNPDYLKVLDDIMEMSSFQGIVGGSPSRALYILGRVGSHYIYLDPHYVQEATTRKSIILNEATFQCNELHLLANKDMDTSMGISFYLRNYTELEKFWAELEAIKVKHAEHFFIYKADETPNYEAMASGSQFISQDMDAEDVIVIH